MVLVSAESFGDGFTPFEIQACFREYPPCSHCPSTSSEGTNLINKLYQIYPDYSFCQEKNEVQPIEKSTVS